MRLTQLKMSTFEWDLATVVLKLLSIGEYAFWAMSVRWSGGATHVHALWGGRGAEAPVLSCSTEWWSAEWNVVGCCSPLQHAPNCTTLFGGAGWVGRAEPNEKIYVEARQRKVKCRVCIVWYEKSEKRDYWLSISLSAQYYTVVKGRSYYFVFESRSERSRADAIPFPQSTQIDIWHPQHTS